MRAASSWDLSTCTIAASRGGALAAFGVCTDLVLLAVTTHCSRVRQLHLLRCPSLALHASPFCISLPEAFSRAFNWSLPHPSPLPPPSPADT